MYAVGQRAYMHTAPYSDNGLPKFQRGGNLSQLSLMLLDLATSDMHDGTVSCPQRTVLNMLMHLQSVSHPQADKNRDVCRGLYIRVYDWSTGHIAGATR